MKFIFYKKFILILFFLFIISCTNIKLIKLKNIENYNNLVSSGIPLPTRINVLKVDWVNITKYLIIKIIKTNIINKKNIILIDQIKNTTNNNISTKNINFVIQDILKKNKFKLVDLNEINITNNKIKFFKNDDHLNFVGKSIIIARYINAKYILYTEIREHVKNYKMIMKLVLVKTGEILCTSSTDTLYK